MTQQNARRTIATGYSTTTSITVDDTTALYDWLAIQASTHKLQWLLLHAETGVVWGEWRNNALALSSTVTLRWNALHQARLFGKHGELFVWQGPQGPQARLIEDGRGNLAEWIDEPQLLWGYAGQGEMLKRNNGFVLLTEGSQGIAHAPPIGNATPTKTQRAALKVRHYIGEDEPGVARITHSRLVELMEQGKGNSNSA